MPSTCRQARLADCAATHLGGGASASPAWLPSASRDGVSRCDVVTAGLPLGEGGAGLHEGEDALIGDRVDAIVVVKAAQRRRQLVSEGTGALRPLRPRRLGATRPAPRRRSGVAWPGVSLVPPLAAGIARGAMSQGHRLTCRTRTGVDASACSRRVTCRGSDVVASWLRTVPCRSRQSSSITTAMQPPLGARVERGLVTMSSGTRPSVRGNFANSVLIHRGTPCAPWTAR